MGHINFVAQKGTFMSYALKRQLFAARLSSFDWISKPSRVLFLEKKEPHNHLFVQISNPHSVHNFSNETLSLAAFKVGLLRPHTSVLCLVYIKMEMESRKNEKNRKQCNDAVYNRDSINKYDERE